MGYIAKTERKHTRRFEEYEKQLLWAINSELILTGGLESPSVKNICEKIGISRVGFYKHFDGVDTIFQENITAMLGIVGEIAENSRKKGYDVRFFLRTLLIQISKSPVRFEIEYNRKSYRFWEDALPGIRDILTRGWTSYGKETDDQIFQRYCAEFVGVMTNWGRYGFSADRIDSCLHQLIRLTETAQKRELEF